MEEKRQISEYNENALSISRLHNHWIDFYKHMEAGIYGKVKEKLESIEIELKYDAKNLEKSSGIKYNTELEKINKKIKDIPLQISKIRKSLKEQSIEKLYNALLHEPLREKAILLKEIQQESGKGSTYKNPEEDEME